MKTVLSDRFQSRLLKVLKKVLLSVMNKGDSRDENELLTQYHEHDCIRDSDSGQLEVM